MGSGKTTLISAMVKILGGDSKAFSPTFSILNEYKVKSDIVYHFDKHLESEVRRLVVMAHDNSRTSWRAATQGTAHSGKTTYRPVLPRC